MAKRTNNIGDVFGIYEFAGHTVKVIRDMDDPSRVITMVEDAGDAAGFRPLGRDYSIRRDVDGDYIYGDDPFAATTYSIQSDLFFAGAHGVLAHLITDAHAKATEIDGRKNRFTVDGWRGYLRNDWSDKTRGVFIYDAMGSDWFIGRVDPREGGWRALGYRSAELNVDTIFDTRSEAVVQLVRQWRQHNDGMNKISRGNYSDVYGVRVFLESGSVQQGHSLYKYTGNPNHPTRTRIASVKKYGSGWGYILRVSDRQPNHDARFATMADAVKAAVLNAEYDHVAANDNPNCMADGESTRIKNSLKIAMDRDELIDLIKKAVPFPVTLDSDHEEAGYEISFFASDSSACMMEVEIGAAELEPGELIPRTWHVTEVSGPCSVSDFEDHLLEVAAS